MAGGDSLRRAADGWLEGLVRQSQGRLTFAFSRMGRKDLGTYVHRTNPKLTVHALEFCKMRITHNFKTDAVIYQDERDHSYHVRTAGDFAATFQKVN